MEHENDKNNVKTILRSGFLMVVIFFLGLYIGLNKNIKVERVTAALSDGTEEVDMSSFWKVWDTIDAKHPGADEIDSKERIYGAISGLVGSLEDPYSVFLDEAEAKAFSEDIKGSFSGVGMEVGMKNDTLTVVAPLKDTPAYRAGIKAGDKILKIDDTLTNGLNVDEAVSLIRGEKGTEVVLTILHENTQSPVEIKIIRDTIQVPTIDTELRSDGIFVIKLYSFTGNSVNLFQKAIKEFVDSKSEKLLLDLRGNPGGYLEASVNMASWFLPKEKVVVVEDYGGEDGKTKKYRSEGFNIFGDNLKFVILIDGGSASASEILAGAMQDYGKAKLVGSQSFGKGSVQELVKVTRNTLLKLTVAKWLTPNGTSISDTGLTPDFEVEVTPQDIEKKRDPQLEKAVEVLNNWYTINQ